MKKILVLLVVTVVVLSCNVFAANFSDLTNEHWAYKPISDMTEKGILNGYPDGSFKPNNSITRAEFAKILVNTLNLTSDSLSSIQFKDVPAEHWAYNYIKVASKYLTGYQNGVEYLYMPDSAAVREDMALAIVTAMGLNNSEYKVDTLNKFSDKSMISENLKKYVAIAAENGLMNGNADGTFNPKGNLTRAEVCQLMLNALNNLEKVAMNTTNSQKDNEVKLSSNKKDGTTLSNLDSIRLTASNYANKVGSLDYRIYYKNELLLPGSFQDGDSIKIKDIIDFAKEKNIQLYGNEITLELFFDNLKENKTEGRVSYIYTIEYDETTVELSANKKDGTTLKDTDSIKLRAGNYNANAGTLDYRIYYNNSLLKPGSFNNGDSLKVKDIIDFAKKQNINLYGKEIMITLFFDNLSENKTEGKVTYNYKIEQKIVPIKDALKKAQLAGETLDEKVTKGQYYEFFVEYTRPLKEAKVEVKDQNGKSVSIVEGKVASEYNDDAINQDISSVRIRIKFELAKKYTFTIKDVIDKEGNEIEDYSFNVYTIVPVKDALVEAQLEGKTIDETNGSYHESFVIYNRPLKEATVEVKDKNGKSVKIIEGKVASEYEDNAVKNDITSVRIRMKYESNNEYTITIKDVVDKQGLKIEDYSFIVKTNAK